MTILFDGQGGVFAERESTVTNSLVLHIPEGMSIYCNSILLFPKEGVVHLHKGALQIGENVFALRAENRLFPCESLFFNGKSVAPGGFSAERMLLAQHKRLCALETAVRELTLRLDAYERKQKRSMLFS